MIDCDRPFSMSRAHFWSVRPSFVLLEPFKQKHTVSNVRGPFKILLMDFLSILERHFCGFNEVLT